MIRIGITKFNGGLPGVYSRNASGRLTGFSNYTVLCVLFMYNNSPEMAVVPRRPAGGLHVKEH